MTSAPTLLMAGATGLALGSYAVTAGLRFARGEASTMGRSHCDACGCSLPFAETVPVLSYLLARGACARCRAGIDPIHLVGELAGLTVVVAAAWTFDPVRTPLLSLLGLTLVAASAIDWKIQRLPDALTLIIAACAALLASTRSQSALLEGIVAALAAGLILLALRAIGRRVRNEPGLGLGDVKLVAALALWLGAWTPWMVVGAAIAGLTAAIVTRKTDQRHPFGPFIALSAWVIGMGLEQTQWPTPA